MPCEEGSFIGWAGSCGLPSAPIIHLFASHSRLRRRGGEESGPGRGRADDYGPVRATQRATTKEASTLSPDEVIQAFENAGLEVGETYPVEQEPGWDANRVPKTYAQAARFTIPSLGVPEEGVPGPRDRGGRVFVFDSQRDLDAVRGYYEALGPSELPHVYVKEQVLLLLQITNDLPKAEADRYGAVLQEAV